MRSAALSSFQLGSVLEGDESSETDSRTNINMGCSSSPPAVPDVSTKNNLSQLSMVSTPSTAPRPPHAEMHPKEVHQTTAKAPDSGLRHGFVDVPSKNKKSAAIAQDTPSRAAPPQSLPQHLTSPTFEFRFASEAHLSSEAQKIMDNVRDEAARIKAQMIAEKSEQDRKDGEAEQLFKGVSGAGRKIAKPRGKAGRFSDVHMAHFKKMDSIANHASSHRAKPGFAQPTEQSLKRSGSKAGLDEPERPRTAGKGTPGQAPPPFVRRTNGTSPFKPVPTSGTGPERLENTSPAKRMRQSEFGDVSNGCPVSNNTPLELFKPYLLPRSTPVPGSSLFTPTKASLARSANIGFPTASPNKVSMLPRSNSVKSLKTTLESGKPLADVPKSAIPELANSRLPRSGSAKSIRPLPPVPKITSPGPITASSQQHLRHVPSPMAPRATPSDDTGIASKLPTFAGLKSILRPSKRMPIKINEASAEPASAGGTPKRNNTISQGSGSAKQVDFTPSTKSRYAVKLAAASPSPSNLSRAGVHYASPAPFVPYDRNAYVVNEKEDDGEWQDAESEVEYPHLSSSPSEPGPLVATFSAKAKEHNRRESKEFKSIFTTLEHPSRNPGPATLTDVNTKVNKTNPATYANIVTQSPSNPNVSRPSASTIRRVRTSGVVQPFEDTIKTVPHGLPGKKRRRESDKHDQLGEDDAAKENRRLSFMPTVPGEWKDDTVLDEDEGEKRGRKRLRATTSVEPPKKVDVKKPNAAREAAARSAKEKKASGKGFLSLSRLNMLSRPKERS